jgi:PAS domain S-box-containing protein
VSPLQILYLEDDARDAELVQVTLEDGGVANHLTRVQDESEFLRALHQHRFDVILADFTLPSFDGMSALKISKETCPETPFIFVTGTLGEEVAIEALKMGATDYVFKARLSRLLPSVQRALREAEEKSQRRDAEEKLLRSEAYLAEAQKLSLTGSFGWHVESGEIYWSRETFRIFGYDPAANVTLELIVQRTHPEDRLAVGQLIERVSRDRKEFDFEHRLLMPDGSVKHLRVVGHPSTTDESSSFEFVGAVTDITERKRAEQTLQTSEAYLAEAQRLSQSGSWAWNIVTQQLYWSKETFNILGIDPESTPTMERFRQRVHPDDRATLESMEADLLAGCYGECNYRIVLPGKSIKHIRNVAHPVTDQSANVVEFVGTIIDVTQQHNAHDALKRAFEEIETLKDQLYKENITLREEVDKASMFEEIVGDSPALQHVLARMNKVAPTDSSVLITGETGTGKELVARGIHKRSSRSSRAFVNVNCAAIPPALIASELFGHEKGAFTGALQRRLGRFELAEGGTIFLDEIGEIPMETQITLLRVLQEREFERVGGNQTIRADVRVIAATNRDLQAAIDTGAFRRDLFYRLNVVPLEIPPLRERKEDMPMLIEYFIDRYARKMGKKIRAVESKTLDLLQSYSWPGNIRELQNVIERSIVICEAEFFSVDPSWLSLTSSSHLNEDRGGFLTRRTADQERQVIEAALAETQGRVSGPMGAAAQLGMPASTLESKIRTLKINKYLFKKA